MFTGIVEGVGDVTQVTADEGGKRIRFSTPAWAFEHGQSVAVDGVCLTVEAFGEDWFEAFTAEETLAKTTLDSLEAGDVVDLERALQPSDRMDGHIVQGHVDTTTEVVAIEQVGEDWRFTFALPAGHEQYVAQKGSITLDGVSLTVAAVDDDAGEHGEFDVAIIPTTYEETTLGRLEEGDAVNVEVDVVAKYVERLSTY
ncbi:riboflavin synthase [Halospeciosus flavus]|uniref:Riboflavin synthase n=1 Tax=Halospeciosus flavus TaxID=3032283 RepID=A0ABD5Z5H2_9EURY|nr:riboflavin synthase [Halospeciosus flavus]